MAKIVSFLIASFVLLGLGSTLSFKDERMKESIKKINALILKNEVEKTGVNETGLKQQEFNTKIFFIKDYNAYSLINLLKPNDDYMVEHGNSILYYNFVKNTVTECNGDDSDSTMIMINNLDNTCVRMTGSVNGSDTSKNVWDAYTQDNTTKLRLKLAQGGECLVDPKANYKVTIELTCNEELKPNITTLDFTKLLEGEQCSYLIEGESKEACPQMYRYIYQSLADKYRIPLAIVFTILGVFLSLVGDKMPKATIISTSFISINLLIISFMFSSNMTHELTIVYITLFLNAIGGIFAGFMLTNLINTYLFLIALYRGYVFGSNLYSLLCRINYFNLSNRGEMYWYT